MDAETGAHDARRLRLPNTSQSYRHNGRQEESGTNAASARNDHREVLEAAHSHNAALGTPVAGVRNSLGQVTRRTNTLNRITIVGQTQGHLHRPASQTNTLYKLSQPDDLVQQPGEPGNTLRVTAQVMSPLTFLQGLPSTPTRESKHRRFGTDNSRPVITRKRVARGECDSGTDVKRARVPSRPRLSGDLTPGGTGELEFGDKTRRRLIGQNKQRVRRDHNSMVWLDQTRVKGKATGEKDVDLFDTARRRDLLEMALRSVSAEIPQADIYDNYHQARAVCPVSHAPDMHCQFCIDLYNRPRTECFPRTHTQLVSDCPCATHDARVPWPLTADGYRKPENLAGIDVLDLEYQTDEADGSLSHGQALSCDKVLPRSQTFL